MKIKLNTTEKATVDLILELMKLGLEIDSTTDSLKHARVPMLLTKFADGFRMSSQIAFVNRVELEHEVQKLKEQNKLLIQRNHELDK